MDCKLSVSSLDTPHTKYNHTISIIIKHLKWHLGTILQLKEFYAMIYSVKTTTDYSQIFEE